mmetsp:Transcript_56805/g.151606  ORF Transcript_56805/g.151606 Transcript_56805/m.151606 type:complete len:287 (+) Transcript_56805:271-1131(+)
MRQDLHALQERFQIRQPCWVLGSLKLLSLRGLEDADGLEAVTCLEQAQEVYAEGLAPDGRGGGGEVRDGEGAGEHGGHLDDRGLLRIQRLKQRHGPPNHGGMHPRSDGNGFQPGHGVLPLLGHHHAPPGRVLHHLDGPLLEQLQQDLSHIRGVPGCQCLNVVVEGRRHCCVGYAQGEGDILFQGLGPHGFAGDKTVLLLRPLQHRGQGLGDDFRGEDQDQRDGVASSPLPQPAQQLKQCINDPPVHPFRGRPGHPIRPHAVAAQNGQPPRLGETFDEKNGHLNKLV